MQIGSVSLALLYGHKYYASPRVCDYKLGEDKPTSMLTTGDMLINLQCRQI